MHATKIKQLNPCRVSAELKQDSINATDDAGLDRRLRSTFHRDMHSLNNHRLPNWLPLWGCE